MAEVEDAVCRQDLWTTRQLDELYESCVMNEHGVRAMYLSRAGVLILTLMAPLSLAAQSKGYPNAERRLAFAPGDTVVLLNRTVHEGGPALRPPGRRLDLQYSTFIPPADSMGRIQQADRAAQFFGPQAVELGVRRLSIGICDTRACAERRDPPAMWYLYERTNSGWRRTP